MRFPLCAVIYLVIALLFPLNCWSAEVITVDPNTPSTAAVPEEPQDFWADARLVHPVNYEALKKPVRDILDDLTQLTGVKLNAGYNANDWQVRDRRMVILAKDLPLKDLMQSIARVMKFQWSRTERDEVWTYRLCMDRKTLLGEEAQRAREEQREKEYLDKQHEKLLGVIDKSSQFTEEELAEMKESDPYSYALVKSGAGTAMADLMRAAPEVRQVLLAGKEVQISGENMSAQAREALVRLAKVSGKVDLFQQVPESEAGLVDISSQPDRLSVRFNEMLGQIDSGEPLKRCIFGDLNISVCGEPDSDSGITRATSYRMAILNPDSELAKSYGRLVSRVVDGEMSTDVATSELFSREQQMVFAERTSKDWGEPLAEHPDDPDLERVVKFELRKMKFDGGEEFECKGRNDIFSALVKATGMSIVSDYFCSSPNYSMTLSPWKSEARIVDALSFIEQNYISNWWRHGGVIEVRDRYWFRKRGMQIPDAWIARWAEECDGKGVIEIDSLAQICSLTEEQFRYNFEYGTDWPYDFFIKGLNVACDDKATTLLLRFYASLSQYQKGALLQGGVGMRTLTQAQWEKLAGLPIEGLAMIAAGRSDTRKPYIDENGKEIGITGDIGYTFTGFAGDGSVVWDQRVPLPWKWERK